MKHTPYKKQELLICIYTSHDDFEIAKKLKENIVNGISVKSYKIVFVLSDPNQPEEFRYDNNQETLFLKVKECYTHLSCKTEAMIKAVFKLFNFEYLLKWDASTLDEKRCHDTVYENGHKIDYWQNCLIELNKNKFKNKSYYSHLKAAACGRVSRWWFNTNKPAFKHVIEAEGRDLNADSFIKDEISFYRGKFYLIDYQFCRFIAFNKKCKEIFKKNFQHNFGNEDMSIGLCFIEFENDK